MQILLTFHAFWVHESYQYFYNIQVSVKIHVCTQWRRKLFITTMVSLNSLGQPVTKTKPAPCIVNIYRKRAYYLIKMSAYLYQIHIAIIHPTAAQLKNFEPHALRKISSPRHCRGYLYIIYIYIYSLQSCT